MKGPLGLLLLFSFVASASAEAVNLVESNFDDEVFGSGKSAFIKFLAPWCGHCKKMKPDWDKLGSEYAKSGSVVIGDVDCTVEKSLCSKYGVKGYPTIKYFTSSTGADGEAYNGGRTYKDLKSFVDENLGASCSNDNPDLCDEAQLKFLEEANAMSPEERTASIKAKDAELKEIGDTFTKEVEKLQKTYEKLQKDKESAEEKFKAENPYLGLLKAANAKPKGGKQEL